jgi:gamma-butyrobetaine dioxygenase/trimethyllysine dioxygenase
MSTPAALLGSPPGERLDPAGLVLGAGSIRVRFADGEHADFHLRWLRHRCDQDRHPITGERTLCSSELPDDLAAQVARTDGDTLYVRWAHDARESRYSGRFLRAYAYAIGRKAPSPPPDDLESIRVARASKSWREIAIEMRARVREYGAAWLTDSRATTSPEAETDWIIQAFSEAGLTVRGTHFGRIEDLRADNTTNANNDQLGYTESAIDVHTDQPFIVKPPRYQLLQGIRAASEGGETALVDAAAAAHYFASIDAPAEALLRETPVDFHRRQKAFESSVVSPILTGSGDRFQIRYSYFTVDPFAMPFERMEAYYRAYDRFARIVRDPRHQRRFSIAPGELLLYDNHRMLHARTAFRGPRWLRGVYFDPKDRVLDDLHEGAWS